MASGYWLEQHGSKIYLKEKNRKKKEKNRDYISLFCPNILVTINSVKIFRDVLLSIL